MTTQSIVLEALGGGLTPLGKIITITNQKGGVGKTSTTFNFAHYLNELGYKVLAIDLDGQGNLTELFFEQDALNQYVHTAAVQLFEEGAAESFAPLKHPSGIDLVATVRNCHELNNVDTHSIESAQVFYSNLVKIAEGYDFAVIDTPPTPGVRTTAGCASADYIFAPVLIDTFAVPALEGVFSSVQSIGQIIGADLQLSGVLINRWQETDDDSRAEYKQLAQAIGSALIPTPVRASKVFVKAQRHGVPVWHIRRSGNEQKVSRETRKAYGEMASRIAEIPASRIQRFNDISKAVRAKLAASA